MSDIVVKNVEGLTFLGRAKSKHWVAMDGPETFGGSEAASRPMELFLVSLAGCTGEDVASLLKTMRVKYDKFEIPVDSERAEEHPKVYTKIYLKYILWGQDLEAEKEKIEKSIDLSQNKYCSISAMIRNANIPVEYSCELLETD
ncbi:MAG: OsmC family protein [Calditrichia bacterium]